MLSDVNLRVVKRILFLIFRQLLGEVICNRICKFLGAVMESDSVRIENEQSGGAHLPTVGSAVPGGIHSHIVT